MKELSLAVIFAIVLLGILSPLPVHADGNPPPKCPPGSTTCKST